MFVLGDNDTELFRFALISMFVSIRFKNARIVLVLCVTHYSFAGKRRIYTERRDSSDRISLLQTQASDCYDGWPLYVRSKQLYSRGH